MKIIHNAGCREQGCWLHPASYEIGKATARAAFKELTSLLTHLNDSSTCVCDQCWKLQVFIENGPETQR